MIQVVQKLINAIKHVNLIVYYLDIYKLYSYHLSNIETIALIKCLNVYQKTFFPGGNGHGLVCREFLQWIKLMSGFDLSY